MEQITTIVKRVLGRVANKRGAPKKDLIGVILKKTLTKREWEHIKFNYFSKGVLSLTVDSSVWLYQLSLKKEGLLLRLNQKYNSDIKDIRFSLGERK